MIKKLLAFLSVAVIAAVSLSAAAFIGNTPNAVAVAAGENLIANPSVEQATNATTPTGWASDKWGTNTTTFSYEATGHTGSRSVKIKSTAYSSGDAKWSFTPVAVTASADYTFSDWYKSTATTDVDVVVTTTDNKVSYLWQGSLPASSAWKQASYKFKAPAKAKTVTVYHYIQAVGELTTDDYSLTQTVAVPPATTAPTVSMTAPAANATVVGTPTLTANATDAQTVTKVQFRVDGVNVGAADTTAPYSLAWDSKTVTNGVHQLSAIATNNSNLSTTSANVAVTVNNPVAPTAPTVSVTAPAANATVAATQNVTANAGGTAPITSVQFKLDGANLGAADTTAPYSVSWDTKTATNAAHTLTAVATNNASLSTTSAVVTVTVNNVVTPPLSVNKIPNPSVEVNVSNVPTGWQHDTWGTNTATFSYGATGHTGGHSLTTTVTKYTDGAANWYYAPAIPIVQGTTYEYSNWYQASVDTEVDIEIKMADNTTQYFYLTQAAASPTAWAEVKGTFTAPTGAVSATFYQSIAAVGTLKQDDFSLTEYHAAPFTRGLVSLTFDDGWRNIYSNALPALSAHNMVSTQYLLTNTISFPDYMTVAMMQAFKDAGHEIASHTVSHAHLPTLTPTQLHDELANSQSQLRTWFGAAPVAENFATPYGEYNTAVIDAIKPLYRSHRSTDVGFNTKDGFNIYNIKVQNIYNTTTAAEVNAWAAQALTDKSWLVLVYHEVADTAVGDEAQYSTTPATLNAMLDKVQASGITVKTVSQALDEIVPQL